MFFRSGEISEATKSLQSLNIREIHNQNWQLTEDRARLKKAGLKMGFDVGQWNVDYIIKFLT